MNRTIRTLLLVATFAGTALAGLFPAPARSQVRPITSSLNISLAGSAFYPLGAG